MAQEPEPQQPLAVAMRGIVKRFPGVVANDGIDLSVRQGEIHALLGENGAGKSTLMNILMGLYPPDAGEILIDGSQVHFHSPRDAVNAGLGMVHQHFMLISRFTVTENVILGNEGSSITLDRKAAERTVGETAERYGLRVDPKALIADLPVGMQQRVEILRVLYQQSRTLILDEPTALLTPQEVQDMYTILLQLKEAGHTVIFITHKLREVAAISDRVTVIRRGKTVGTRETRDTTAEELAELMVGRDVRLHIDRPPAQPGDAVLQVFDLHLKALAIGTPSMGSVSGCAGVRSSALRESKATAKPRWSNALPVCKNRRPAPSCSKARKRPAGIQSRCARRECRTSPKTGTIGASCSPSR